METKTKVITLRVTPEQKDKIRQLAEAAGVTMTELILCAVDPQPANSDVEIISRKGETKQ